MVCSLRTMGKFSLGPTASEFAMPKPLWAKTLRGVPLGMHRSNSKCLDPDHTAANVVLREDPEDEEEEDEEEHDGGENEDGSEGYSE